MKRTFKDYARNIGVGLVAGAAALSLSWFLKSAEPTVIRSYTENGREITLLDYDGDLSTAEERVTRGRFSAFGSEPPVDGYTEKREFEPARKTDRGDVNTEVSFYDKNKRRVEGPIRTLEPRQGRLEIPKEQYEQLAKALEKLWAEDSHYVKLAERIWKYVVDKGGIVDSYGEDLIGTSSDRLSALESGLGLRKGEKFVVKSFYESDEERVIEGVIGSVQLDGFTPRRSLKLVKVDASADQSERREFNDMNLDGKITGDESHSSNNTKEYRWFLKMLTYDLGLEVE